MRNLFLKKLNIILVLASLMSFTCLLTVTAQTITSNQTGNQGGYFYTFWTDGGGSVSMTLGSGGQFSVNWSNCGNFVCGKGWSTGSTRTITWSGSASGAQYFGVYGWMQNPLVEYYIPRSGGTNRGTYSADGTTYTLYTNTRTNQPSIEGTRTFEQYFCSGGGRSVNFGQHMEGWRKLGMGVGSQNYQVVAVEGWGGSSGSANVTVGSGSSSTTTSSGGSTTTSSGGSTTTSTGSGNITVRARGTKGGERIEVRVNGSTVATHTLTSSYANYSANGSGQIRVAFTNDDQQSSGMDVQVDYITVSGTTYQAENQATNTGVYQNSQCGGSNNEWLHCNGYIEFNTSGSTPGPTPGSTTTTSSGGSTTTSSGSGNITVRARGTKGGERIEVRVNGSTVATHTLTSSYANYSANGSGQIRVAFTNDDQQSSGMDVQVDYITVSGTTYQAENQATNTGVYQNSQCGGSNNEWLHCNGYIQFSTSGGTTTTSSGGSTTTTSSSSGSCSGSSGNVYLTFDDGPTGNTGTIVNSLKNGGACKATFFVMGQNMPGNSSAYKSAGFSVQNHSQTHSHMTSWSYQQVYNDLQQCSQAIQNAGFPKPTVIRLPYLESNSTIQQACSALGLQIISPSVDTQDWNGASTQSIISTASNLGSGQNPLMHENQGNTVSAVATIVQNLKNRGMGFTQY